MSNTCNAISTREDEETQRRIPWRYVAVIFLVLATVFYTVNALRDASDQLRADSRGGYLALAGPVAEEVEHSLAEEAVLDPQALTELFPPLFAANDSLAAFRIWDKNQQLLGEVTRTEPATLRAGEHGILPDLGQRHAQTRLSRRVKERAWTDRVAQVQLIESEQRQLTLQLEEVNAVPVDSEVRSELYLSQEHILGLLEVLDDSMGGLTDARAEINRVLEAITRDDQALPDALEPSYTVLANLTYALTAYRAEVSDTPALPRALAEVAPASSSWQERLCPFVHGRRVLVPLFVPVANEQFITHAGFVEVIFYARPSAVLAQAGWRLLPGVLCLLLAAFLLRKPRHRKVPESQPQMS